MSKAYVSGLPDVLVALICHGVKNSKKAGCRYRLSALISTSPAKKRIFPTAILALRSGYTKGRFSPQMPKIKKTSKCEARLNKTVCYSPKKKNSKIGTS